MALYARRVQIEQSFRDSKGRLGRERKQTKQPWVRPRSLLSALRIGYTLDPQLGGAVPRSPHQPPPLPRGASRNTGRKV